MPVFIDDFSGSAPKARTKQIEHHLGDNGTIYFTDAQENSGISKSNLFRIIRVHIDAGLRFLKASYKQARRGLLIFGIDTYRKRLWLAIVSKEVDFWANESRNFYDL